MITRRDVFSRSTAEGTYFNDKTLVICFGSSEQPSKIQGDVITKYWSFDDVDERDNLSDKERHLTDEQAKEIATFFKNHQGDVQHLVVHCDAGVSRSAGAMMAFLEYLYNSNVAQGYMKSKPHFVPNTYVYNKIMKYLKE